MKNWFMRQNAHVRTVLTLLGVFLCFGLLVTLILLTKGLFLIAIFACIVLGVFYHGLYSEFKDMDENRKGDDYDFFA